jgi:hypothetical protein
VRLRFFALSLLAAASVQAAEPVPANAPEAKRPVLAPHYGDTLFHFWQDKYFRTTTTARSCVAACC